MKRLSAILLLSYYAIGSFLLPLGDFSSMRDLPKMYQHCKATEDVDMTLFDFITDHLLNIDGLFDKHDNSDPQKPHAHVQFQHTVGQTILFVQPSLNNPFKPFLSKSGVPNYIMGFILADYSSLLFRPPIA